MSTVSLQVQRSLAALFRHDFENNETTQAYLDRMARVMAGSLPPGRMWFCDQKMSVLGELLSGRRLTTVFRSLLREIPHGARAVVVDAHMPMPDGIFLIGHVEGDPTMGIRILTGCVPNLRVVLRRVSAAEDLFIYAVPFTALFR